ncbi:hypothetical protein DICVIV_13851 [Dictyocaulus viviparus]|uniref:Uncharacterized protein n=1 Tax=Dictyocaulus viviparus TaxID=29172 RepID=A0A0D8X6T0_DICVI|nr:hypothetical protein DICVIV_13851 [Dictyocaulus viviparus]
MASLQQRTDALLAEKSKLELELKKVSVNNRLAEERRRKLLDMEKQLSQMKRQMTDLKRIEKQKLRSEEMQKQMRAEIDSLKQAKVRMMRQQREEAEKYRQWKLKHDRELMQIKQKELKRGIEAAREKRTHEQQMLICKQRLEEAKKVNKRLLSQMEKSAAVARDKQNEKTFEQAKHIIEAELALIGSSYEAEQMCHSLKNQRKQLSRKRSYLLKERDRYVNINEPLSKRRSTEDGARLSIEDDANLQRINEDLERIDQQQVLFSDELNQLQRGCGSIDFDSRAESLCNNVLTVASARVYLKALLEQATNERKVNVDKELELEQTRRKIKDLEDSIRREKKERDEESRVLHESNRKLLSEYEKHKSQVDMQLLNLVALISTTKPIDKDAVEELKRFYSNLESMSEIRKQLETAGSLRPKSSKAFMRSRSSSCMEKIDPKMLTTEEERRTRASRARIQRFGNVKNPIQEVEVESDDDYSIADVSYRPQSPKRKPRIVTDLSPILDLTKQSVSVDDGNISSRNRRLSMQLHQPPLSVVDGMEKENTLWNQTFVMNNKSAASSDGCVNAEVVSYF